MEVVLPAKIKHQKANKSMQPTANESTDRFVKNLIKISK